MHRRDKLTPADHQLTVYMLALFALAAFVGAVGELAFRYPASSSSQRGPELDEQRASPRRVSHARSLSTAPQLACLIRRTCGIVGTGWGRKREPARVCLSVEATRGKPCRLVANVHPSKTSIKAHSPGSLRGCS